MVVDRTDSTPTLPNRIPTILRTRIPEHRTVAGLEYGAHLLWWPS